METRQPVTAPAEISRLLTASLGSEPVSWFVPHTGISNAQRFIVHLADGASFFVKAAGDRSTERQLRIEHELLSTVTGDFLPRQVAWITAGQRPILVLEDLSAAHWPADHWPVEWRPGQFQLLFDVLRRVGEVAPALPLPLAQTGFEARWPAIAQDPASFLALGICSERWFRASAGKLIAAEAAVPLAGSALVHNDVRSDNLCFQGGRVVLVDWGSAVRGNPDHDLATLLTTLPLEGGPDPWTVLPAAGEWAAYHAGQSAGRLVGGLSRQNGPDPIPDWLVRVMSRICAISLSWAAEALDLAPFEGLDWRQDG